MTTRARRRPARRTAEVRGAVGPPVTTATPRATTVPRRRR
ncbi:hypothetical protein M2316_003719 [Cellulosimicrobium cellulans]|nr:hypothetical protein [Cellulosimicrobium cellulans]